MSWLQGPARLIIIITQPLQLGHMGAAEGERGSAPTRQLVAEAMLMWAVEGMVLELSLPCGWGRLLLWDGFVLLLGETCLAGLWRSAVCSSPPARVITELLLWMLCALHASQTYGRPLRWPRWPQVTVPQAICQPVLRDTGNGALGTCFLLSLILCFSLLPQACFGIVATHG